MVEFIKMVGRQVRCERLNNEEFSAGGIVLPVEVMLEKNVRCKLLQKGRGEIFHHYDDEGNLTVVTVPSTEAEPGDTVLVRAFDGVVISNLDKKTFTAIGDAVQGVFCNEPWPPAGQRG